MASFLDSSGHNKIAPSADSRLLDLPGRFALSFDFFQKQSTTGYARRKIR
jgi:hypothetical protein